MMSHRTRTVLEVGLRAVAFAALGALIVHAFHALGSMPSAHAAGAAVDGALVRWSTREAPGRVYVALDTAANVETRDWLAALGRAGTAVSWGGAAPAPSALAVEPVADPRRPARVWLAAPAGTSVLLRDSLGSIDTAYVARRGARVEVPDLDGTLHAIAAGFEASSALRDSLVLRPILVLGQAGWEAKFTVAALEERGWGVEARLAVAPSGDVRQGAGRVTIDTARYAAVIAVDSVAARYASQIIRYVRAGGGLIAAGEAAGLGALAAVLPARAAESVSPPGAFTTAAARTEPRAALALEPLAAIEAGAVVLETRRAPEGAGAAVAAWRVGDGRVLQIGYRDIWRWRMAGAEDDAVRAHRDWWASLVSSVAYSPRVPRVSLDVTDRREPTPLASFIAALGPATTPASVRVDPLDDRRLVPALFGILMLSLLLEWFSRRRRGVR